MNDPRPLWHGRFQEGPSDELLAFTTSLGYDRELAVDDLAGSRAHVNMLAKVGLISPEEKGMLLTALTRGAFDYQGQKCSAASRAYIPRSMWEGGLRDRLAANADGLAYGDVTDFGNFGGAVIDDRAFAKHAAEVEGR